MLILTRAINQKIYIGKENEIEIVLVNAKNGQAMIGIKADKDDFPVKRSELVDGKKPKPQKAIESHQKIQSIKTVLVDELVNCGMTEEANKLRGILE
jgi:sRNA-binding carbon storage regulator CsrA